MFAQPPPLNRRQFLERSALSAGYLLLPPDPLGGGRFLQRLEFQQEGPNAVATTFGSEMEQRRFTDLSRIASSRIATPTADFFVRTGASALLPPANTWAVEISGLVERPVRIDIQSLKRAAKPMGLHLMECAGNVRLAHFGLISVANWTGVLLAELIDRAGIAVGATQVNVSGFDQYSASSTTSIPGADWIFRLETLQKAGAFLATGMNGFPLTRDHGAPVRLVVPGAYGCSCIKWVQRITLVDDTVEATSQMREYAVRTLQDGQPVLAKDYEPPTIDCAAVPIRVEKWLLAGKLRYRVTGILWGGTEPASRLLIRFNPDQEFVPVEGFHQDTQAPWTIWEYIWSPSQPGLYAVQLAVSEPRVRARKMDTGLYVRFVEIDAVS